MGSVKHRRPSYRARLNARRKDKFRDAMREKFSDDKFRNAPEEERRSAVKSMFEKIQKEDGGGK